LSLFFVFVTLRLTAAAAKLLNRMDIKASDDIEKYAGSDVGSRAETGEDGRVSGLAGVGEVRADDGTY
jgi:hypothetical protein